LNELDEAIKASEIEEDSSETEIGDEEKRLAITGSRLTFICGF
jgi:hypothetical protein